jgi:hypothetical protein
MSQHRTVLGAAALALAFGAAFVLGHAGGEPSAAPVRSQMLTVSRDLPAIPALAVPGAPPVLAKPARRARSPKRHRDDEASPSRPAEQRAEPHPGTAAAARPPAAGRDRSGPPAHGGGGRRSGGGGGGDSPGDGDPGTQLAAPAPAAPAPTQVAPAPIELEPEESEEEPAPEEEAE